MGPRDDQWEISKENQHVSILSDTKNYVWRMLYTVLTSKTNRALPALPPTLTPPAGDLNARARNQRLLIFVLENLSFLNVISFIKILIHLLLRIPSHALGVTTPGVKYEVQS